VLARINDLVIRHAIVHSGSAVTRLGTPDLIEFVGQRIARFKKPKHVVFVAQLPRTASGQIDRQAVKREYGQG
jgi:acyl-coenzyme A synthetase/AMP-(fatty) acid ligase